MTNNTNIRHTGIVERVVGDVVSVRILQASACSTCSAAQLCKSSESKEKVIDIHTPNARQYSQGQTVTIAGSTTQGLKATFWAYVLPLFLLVAVLFLVRQFAASESLAALAALLVLALYYAGLYLMRSRLERQFTFRII